MTKILSQKIENLSPEIQVEVLHYVESLLKKKSNSEYAPPRMTLDKYQERNSHSRNKEVNPPHESIHYTIW
jgi:hypothetical protein